MSLPSRKRGLKSLSVTSFSSGCLVASLAEAWIEMVIKEIRIDNDQVASLAEAWIEITLTTWQEVVEKVASLAEAWIEID